MGVLSGQDSDIWVTAAPSIPLAAGEGAPNSDSGAWLQYTAGVHRYWDKYTPVVIQVGTDAKQSVTITGTPTGGTFVLRFGGVNSGAINWNTTAAQLQTILTAMTSIGAGGCIVTGGPGPGAALIVEFTGPVVGGAPQALMTLQTNSLTGGVSPSVTMASTQTGIAWATNSANSFQFVGGVITFNSALASTQVVQILSGNFFNVIQLGTCTDWTLDEKSTLVDITVFQAALWQNNLNVILGATGTITSFLHDATLDPSLANILVFILYISKTANSRFECYGWLTDEQVKSSAKGVITKTFNFTADGAVYYRTT